MYATRRLLRAPKGVPTWAQHMAKQPTKAGRLPPQQWANAPETGHDDAPEASAAPEAPSSPAGKVPPTDWQAVPGAGSEARAWEDIRRREPDARPAAQPGPNGPKTDRTLSPNQRILIGATLFVFGLGIYAYDSLLMKEEELEVSDDLRERLAKASAIARTASSEGLRVDDVAPLKQGLEAATAKEAETLRAAEVAVAAAAERGVNRVLTDAVQDKERVVEAVVDAVEHARADAQSVKNEVRSKLGTAAQQVHDAGDAVVHHAQKAGGDVKGHLQAAGHAVADTVDGAVSDAGVVAGAVPERTRFFGIRLR
ncbi:unnamed protein product [Cutaneotrichosporon oleaginosum]